MDIIIYLKASQKGYELLYTGSGGDYIQSGNYTNYWYYLADLFYEKKLILIKNLIIGLKIMVLMNTLKVKKYSMMK